MIRVVPAFVALALLLGACASIEPFDIAEGDDIPEGPGVFTGQAGEWVILGD